MTSYEDYDVPAGGGKFDDFSNTEAQFRIGGGAFPRAGDGHP
ncbi:hypothetical protein [Brevundimonas sp.]|nr:hypothetical protein [Brevundimonas sp.]MDI1281421.1 hypothetical protein [Brevundimonas sp.]